MGLFRRNGRQEQKTGGEPAAATPAPDGVVGPAQAAAQQPSMTTAETEGDVSDLISEGELSIERLESLFKSAFLRVERDKENDVLVRDDSGINTFIKVDRDKKLITYFCLFGLKSRFSDEDKLKFINDLNNGLIVVRFSLAKGSTLWCDYDFHYDGGIPAFLIMANYRRFVSVCRSAAQRDTADMIGRD